MKKFTHLHNHSSRSLLDGHQSPQAMAETAAKLGQTAIGLTDHGNLFGAYTFHAACAQHGVKPIIGIEAYVAPDSRFNKERVLWGTPEQSRDDVAARGAYTHLSLWAGNETGLRNLYALTTDSYISGKFGKYARMDRDIIAEHASGLIASTGCPSGEVQTRLRLGQFDAALDAAADYQDIFGRDRYFLELMDHGIEIEQRVRDGLLEIGRKLGIPPLVTNDAHYAEAQHAEAHDALLCVNTRSRISDVDRFRFDGTGYYLKSTQEMYGIDSSSAWQQGCMNTLLVAEMAEGYGELFERRDLMPRFPCPDGFTEETLLRTLTRKGLEMKVEQGQAPRGDSRYDDRLTYELDVINNMGFPGYFLIVGDAVAWAKRNNIETGPGRGSAAASLVCWVLGITAVDPIEHGLVFERFLNPERVTMPDIDLDFEDKDRVGAYLAEKYGEDKVARISTLMEVKSKNALKDAARVLGAPFAAGDMLTRALPPDVFGSPAPLSALHDKKHPRHKEMERLRKLAAEPQYAEIVDLASRLEGVARGTGIHAGGVVVSKRPLIQDVPLAVQSSHQVTQYDMNEVEALGLLKIDTLGLITLGTLRRAVETTGVDREAIPQDDQEAWALLGSGHTTGVFQLESTGMQDALRQIKPTNLGDLAAVIALYRPGPLHVIPTYAARKHGREPVQPIHPELKGVLEAPLGSTFHLLVYQEQVMKAAQSVCGWSLGKADLLRRAMGKKDKAKLAVLEPEFFADGMRQGYSREAMQLLWDAMTPFAGYGFNQPHAVAYATTGYLAAYLKAHFPKQYMASHLESAASRRDKDEEKDKFLLALAEVRRMGIKLLPPDIDRPFSGFRVEEEGIRYGLDMVKGVGTAAVEDIAAGAPYGSLLDYMVRAGKGKNAGTVKALASAGAMTKLGCRKGIVEAAPAMAKRIAAVKKYKKKDNSLTEENIAVPVGEEEYDQAALLALEKEHLGTYVSAHPLDDYQDVIAKENVTPLGTLEDLDPGAKITVIGSVVSAAERETKKGKPYGSVKIADYTGDTRFSVWSSTRNGAITWDKVKGMVEPGTVIKVTGRWSANGSFTGLEVQRITRLTPADRQGSSALADFMLWWARQGVPVIAQEGRVPGLLGGILDATCDERLIRHMAGHPRATAYGIRCGRGTGILGIDLDMKNGVDGIASFGRLVQEKGGTVPETMMTATPSGGRHVLLKVPEEAWEWLYSAQNAALGIDLRCEGITGPGSRNEAGVYRPVGSVREIAEATPEVLAVLKELCTRARREVDYSQDVNEGNMRMKALFLIGPVSEEEVEQARPVVEQMIEAQLEKIGAYIGMPEGSGLTGQLHSSACALGHYVPVYLGWAEACELLFRAALEARPGGDERAFLRNIRRGLRYGAEDPDRILPADYEVCDLEFEITMQLVSPEVAA